MARIASDACALLDVDAPDLQVEVVDGFLGPAKGVRSPEGDVAAELVARTEGVFLDPVFAAKAMAGLLAAAYDGSGGGTGGLPGERRSPHPLHGLTATRDRPGCLLRRSRAGRA